MPDVEGFNLWQEPCASIPELPLHQCSSLRLYFTPSDRGGMAEIPPAGLIIGLRAIFFINMSGLPKKAGYSRALRRGLMPSNRGRFTETGMKCFALKGQLARLVNITYSK